eukprot:g33683.t1
MKRRSNLRVAAVAHDLAATINVDAAFLSSVADVQRGLGKGESLFQQTMTAFRDGDVAALSGCVCCPGFDDALSFAVRSALTQGADTGLLDYLVVETSGAADPRRIAERVVAEGQRWELAQEQQTAEEQLQLVQLSVADLVLLNKVDLIKDEDVVWAKQLLQRLCPDAKVLPCRHGDVPVPDLLDVEDNPTCWKMSSSSTESSRPSHDRGFKGVDMNIHHRVAEWSTRDRGSKPVRLARLQHLLCEKLPRLRRWLRRGKGLLRSERVIHSENHDFRSAVGRTMVGIKLARRFSVGAVGVGATAFTQTAPIVPLPRRRMSDGMLLVTERTASKSSQLSLQSIMEQNSHGSASGDGASSSSSSSATPEQPEEVVQATHSILVHEPLDDAPGEPEEGVDDPDTNAETIRLDLDQLANDSRIEDDELPADVGHIDRGADATLEEEVGTLLCHHNLCDCIRMARRLLHDQCLLCPVLKDPFVQGDKTRTRQRRCLATLSSSPVQPEGFSV